MVAVLSVGLFPTKRVYLIHNSIGPKLVNWYERQQVEFGYQVSR